MNNGRVAEAEMNRGYCNIALRCVVRRSNLRRARGFSDATLCGFGLGDLPSVLNIDRSTEDLVARIAFSPPILFTIRTRRMGSVTEERISTLSLYVSSVWLCVSN